MPTFHFVLARRRRALRPVVPMDIRIDDHVVKIQPDALFVSTVVGATGHRPMLAHRAAACATFKVMAVAILVVGNQVRLP